MTRRLLLVLAAVLVMSGAALAPRATIHVKIAAINDLHGYLEPPPETMQGATGGVAYLTTMVRELRARHPHFTFVSAGDLVGATPLMSALFDDEPVIEAMNVAGLDLNGVGNHEFDYGAAHLKRLQAGGCPSGGCKSGATFAGARFQFLAANVIETATRKTLFPPYAIKTFDGVKVAFIGLTLRETASVVVAAGTAGLEFRDEANAVNALVPELRAAGVESIVVVLHQGGTTSGGPNECTNLRGPIERIVQRFDRAVDLVISGHTHQAYICEIGGRLVTSAGSYGRFLTEIDLEVDRKTRDVVSARAVNLPVTAAVKPDPAQLELIGKYQKLAAHIHRVVGRITAPFNRTPNRDGESRLGQLMADAHLEATRGAGAVVAFLNPGGIRAALPYTQTREVTLSDVYTVYPFNNWLVTITLTGAQVLELLEQQWRANSSRVLQVSKGFKYDWDPNRAPGERVLRESVTVAGRPLDPGAEYRVTVNSYLAGGGDGFTVLLAGHSRSDGIDGREAIVKYLEAHSPVSPDRERRIRRLQ